MAASPRILSNWLGEEAYRNPRTRPGLHDINLVASAVPVGAGPPPVLAVEKTPFDVWFLVFRHLEYSDALAFSQTCRTFYNLTSPDALVSAEEKSRHCLRVEKFRRHGGLLVCFSCMRLRPRSCFGDKQATNRRGKNGIHPEEAMKRYCWDCAASKRLCLENQPVRKDGYQWYLCHTCGVFKHKSQRCVKKDVSEGDNGSATKRRPRGSSGGLTICTPAWPATVQSVLESRLPAALQSRIIDQLGYRDRMSLAATNRHFRQCARPLDAPLADKVAVVKGASDLNVGWSARGPWACMGCFRARPEASFTGAESAAKKWWSRRCRSCCAFVKAGRNPAKPIRECWVCLQLTDAERCPTCKDEGPRWDRIRALQTRRKKTRMLAGVMDFSVPLFVMMDDDDAAPEEEAEPVQAHVGGQPGAATATLDEDQDQDATPDGGEVMRPAEDGLHEELPEERIGSTNEVSPSGSQATSSAIYRRLQRFLPHAHPLRRHHPPRTAWGLISERLRNALLAR